MPVIRVPAGRAALVALRDAVIAAKGADPLAPVTVAVPSSYSGLSLRRLLASGELGPVPGGAVGLVNVRFLVGARIAELLGVATLAGQGRRPLSPPVRAEAVRSALGTHPGSFRPVADHPATERALERLFVELRSCEEATLDTLAAQSRRAADVVALFRSARSLLEGWYDEHDLVVAATRAITDGSPALTDIGHLVVFRTELDGSPSSVPDVAVTLAAAMGAHTTEVVAVLDGSCTGTSLISVPDADEEARTVARELVARVRSGVPLHRMAVGYPTTHPYAVLLDQHLEAAGIARNGPSIGTLAQTVAGSALLGMLDLAEHGFQRDALIGWLAGAPVIDPSDGRPVDASAWDTESRQAGVVTGLAQWLDRLGRHAQRLAGRRRELAADPDVDPARITRLDGRIASVFELGRFVVGLDKALDCSAMSTWSEFARWSRTVLEAHMGGPSAQLRWPDVHQHAWDTITQALDRLSVLDGFGARADLPTFRRAVERELEAPAGRVGAFGDGVFVAPMDLMAGIDVDVMFIVGMVEGLLPGAPHRDALLPESERFAAGSQLGSGTRGIEDQQRDYVSALAASTGERVLLAPRADLGRNREHLPSRWLLASAAALSGSTDPVSGDDLARLCDDAESIHFVPSFLAGSVGATEPASLQDRDLADLASWTGAGHPAGRHPITRRHRRLGAGFAAEAARRSDRFTEFDGRVTAGSIGLPSPETALSPTSLERYATCPRQYLFTLLGVGAVDRPEEVTGISAMERGSVVHAILEGYIKDVLQGGPRTLDNLMDIGARHLDEVERTGSTGRPLRWRYDRELIERELRRFYAEDNLTPVAAELAFGDDDHAAVVLALPTGRQVAFRGYADRVDRTADHLLVTDYKTGSDREFKQLRDDPVARGTKLQLPIYGLAARDRFGDESTAVEARYWFVSERSGFRSASVSLDDETLDRFTHAVSVAVEGIAAGSFPARPGDAETWPTDTWKNCVYCPFDRLCPTDRGRHWERKREAPEIQDYRELAEGDVR